MYITMGYLLGDRYKIIRELGRGGWGITYIAEDTQNSNNSQCVVKEIKGSEQLTLEENQIYFNREVAALKILGTHSQIPCYIDSFVKDDKFYIVQEFISGNLLSKQIQPGKIFKERKVRELLIDILEVLQFIHSQNTIHRDLKPSNIIRRDDGDITIIDYGTVKEIYTLNHTNLGNLQSILIGSQPYIAPERYIFPKPSGIDDHPRVDIYSLGIIGLQAITGLTPQQLYIDPITDTRLWSEAINITPNMKNILNKMSHGKHNLRYQNVDEVLRDLQKIESENKTTHIVKSTPRIINYQPNNNKQKSKRKNLVIGSIILSSLSIIGGIYWQRAIFNPACDLKTKDYISCGEEILYSHSKDINRKRASEYFAQNKYQEALRYFNRSWGKRREAETLIYLNNTILKVLNADYYTLVVTVPLSYEGIKAKNYELAQEFLRGVALAQTQVNLSLLDAKQNTNYNLPGQDFLARKVISNAKKPYGLRIVIADDRNNTEHTKILAKNIANKSEILGVIGHYASNISLSAVDIYNKKNLSQVSFGTTTIDLTENPKRNFFRVVYTNYEEAEAIVNSIEQIDIYDKKIAVFYNPGSIYSSDFWGEIDKIIKEKNQTTQVEKAKIEVVKIFNLADDKNFHTQTALKAAKQLQVNIFVLLPDGQISNALANAIDVIKQDNGNTEIIGGNPLLNSKVEQIKTTSPIKLKVSAFWHHLSEPEAQFTKNSQRLWEIDKINSGTATAYDAALTLIEAIRQQDNPTRQGTLKKLAAPGFFVRGATDDIQFNSPQNGDRNNFKPTTIKLVPCGNNKIFVPVNTNNNITAKLSCN